MTCAVGYWQGKPPCDALLRGIYEAGVDKLTPTLGAPATAEWREVPPVAAPGGTSTPSPCSLLPAVASSSMTSAPPFDGDATPAPAIPCLDHVSAAAALPVVDSATATAVSPFICGGGGATTASTSPSVDNAAMAPAVPSSGGATATVAVVSPCRRRDLSQLEVFARNLRRGWISVGNEALRFQRLDADLVPLARR